MADLLVLAFQGDLTRVSTFVFANEGSNRSYKAIGVPEGHHDLSHHGNNKDKQAKLQTINHFHVGAGLPRRQALGRSGRRWLVARSPYDHLRQRQ